MFVFAEQVEAGSIDVDLFLFFVGGECGVEVLLGFGADLDVVVSVEGTAGPDVNAAILLVTAVWRPFP